MNLNYQKNLFYIFSFLIPFLLFLVYNLNHFYYNGGYTFDDGWFAYLATNSTAFPPNNPNIIGGTFFSTHISLFFYILTSIYYPFQNLISEVTFFSIYLALINSLLSYAIFNITSIILDFNKLNNLIIGLLISITTSLNGVVLSAIGFPHIELAIPILIILFLSLYFTNKQISSYLTLFFLLLIREDAGFHLFATLFILTVFLYFMEKDRKYVWNILSIAIVGLLYSMIIIYWQKTNFIGDNALERVYFGNPAFAHLTKQFFLDRFHFILNNKEYIYIPTVMLVILSILSKNRFLIIPLIAIFPWVLLSMIAISFQAGTFTSYYAFPFILLVSWPSIAFTLQYLSGRKINEFSFFASFFLITISSILLFPNNYGSHDSSPWEKIGFQFTKNISHTDKFINYLSQNTDELYVDDHIASLMTKYLIPNKTWMGFNIQSNNYINKNINLIAFLENEHSQEIKYILAIKHLDYLYAVPNSKISLASKNKIQDKDFLVLQKKRTLPFLKIGEEISFDSKKVNYLGWSQPEKYHMWSLNSQSLIKFNIEKIDSLKGKLILNFATLDEQKIKIKINNIIIKTISTNNTFKPISFDFNKNIIHNGINILEFNFPTAKKPNNGDQRVLAMALKSFSIE
ncbi:DUF2079 domain-containing protein [Aliarcobacter cryaerophilus]|uniref:hypothetical protein n=1 Tax=Aliarcobacter cryaerophilus TaxID=28198 RepID=UPI003DA51BC7